MQLRLNVPTLADGIEVFWPFAAGFDPLQCIDDAAHAREIGDGVALPGRDLLGQVVHAANACTTSAGRRCRTRENARQRALADAVATDQTGMPAVELFVEFGEQETAVGQLPRDALQRQRDRVRHEASSKSLRLCLR